ASRSLSGFAGSVRAAPGTRVSGCGAGEISVVSASKGEGAAATDVSARPTAATTPISVGAGAFRRDGGVAMIIPAALEGGGEGAIAVGGGAARGGSAGGGGTVGGARTIDSDGTAGGRRRGGAVRLVDRGPS